MPEGRSLKFYTELVLVTVLSLVAANAWIRFLQQVLDYYYPGSLKVDFLVATIMTMLAILILYWFFSRPSFQENKLPKAVVRSHVYD